MASMVETVLTDTTVDPLDPLQDATIDPLAFTLDTSTQSDVKAIRQMVTRCQDNEIMWMRYVCN